MLKLFLMSSLTVTTACSKNEANTDHSEGDTTVIVQPPVTVPAITYDITQLEYATQFETKPIVVAFQRQDYNELSGVCASQLNTGILYVHNDYRNAPIVITNAQGEDLGKIVLDGISSLDPEDISVGPGPIDGKTYIYLADIGDNKFTRSEIVIFRFEEPRLTNPGETTEIHVADVAKIVLKYPSGSFNAETFLLDPLSKDIFIATKEKGKSTIFKASWPQSLTATTTLEPVLKTTFDLLTAGDISADGKGILLRNKGQVWYWNRKIAATITATLQTAPQMAPYAGNEHQGEGIGFAADDSGYYTNTEIRDYPGAISNLSFYKRKD